LIFDAQLFSAKMKRQIYLSVYSQWLNYKMEEFINMVNKHSWSSSQLASHKMNQAFQESGSSLQSVPTFRLYSNNLTVRRRIFPQQVINVDPDARIAELQRSFLVQVG
jgi:hypothetical protein